MTRRRKRISLIVAAGLTLASAAGLVLIALSQNITFFRSPSDILSLQIAPGTRMRIGGLVQSGTLVRSNASDVAFAVTDGSHHIAVAYQGLLPDLFREGQGVVAEGRLQQDGSFLADTILAKHDETYMPREVVDALKRQGRWQEGGVPASPSPVLAGAKRP